MKAEPVHLDGYAEQLKRDIRRFRDDSAEAPTGEVADELPDVPARARPDIPPAE